MKTTQLAEKKLENLLRPTPRNNFEIAIRSKLIYDRLPVNNGFVKCTADDIWKIAHRAWYYGISIVGVESNIDEDVPFYDFCIEDYEGNVQNFGEHNPTQWIITATLPLVIKHPGIQLKFYIDIPDMNIPVLEKTTGIKYVSEKQD